jgi:type I restriction enzyme R subunit
MPNIITEQQIENAVLDVFIHNLGYRHINAQYQDTTGRCSEEEVVLESTLRNQLKIINPQLPQSAIDEAVARIVDNRVHLTDVAANKELYSLIKDGVPVTLTNIQGKEDHETVKIIDFDDETKNDYLVVSQLWIRGKLGPRRTDLLVYVNGLPLVFIELKNSNINVRSAYDDNVLNYRKDIMQLFHHNAFCILSNGISTRIGAYNAEWDHYFLWQRVEKENEKLDKERIQQYGVSLDYAVLGLCHKKRLLDYIENFIFFYKDTKKICGKNHQFLGVNNLVGSFASRIQHDKAGTDVGNKGKLGVFWHTQGSGKSYSMVFFARKVFRKFTGNYTFLIVTDREDLDSQIYRNFLGADAFKKTVKCRPANSEDLRGMLQTNTRYIFTLIHKFRFDKGKKYPVLSTRNDIVVIVDEAHRTQYKDLADNMRIGLPNAQFVAFTGTPLLGSRQLTNDWFGTNVSEYNFKQSVEDGATVPLFYQKRVPEVQMQNDELDDDFADIVNEDNLNADEQDRLVHDFSKEMTILTRDDRLETIARDLVYHLPRRGYLGKAMVIAVDKFTAVKMFDKVKRLWDEEKRELQKTINSETNSTIKEDLKKRLEWMRQVDMAVVVSEEAGEEEKFRKEGLNIVPHRKRMQEVDENGQELEDKFKEPSDKLQVVFVCSMWLTGFDAPTVSTLYLDKPMKDHTLMQTIARANRVTGFTINNQPKTDGLVVDYYNVFRNLKKAFASYGGGDPETGDEDLPIQDKTELYKTLADAINECVSWCAVLHVDLDKLVAEDKTFGKIGLFDKYADILLSNDEYKRQFGVYENTISALYEACRPEILNRKNEFVLKQAVTYLREVLDGKVHRTDLDGVKRKINRLLDDSIVADTEFTANIREDDEKQRYAVKAWKRIDLSKLDVEKLKEEYKHAEYKHIEIADLRAFIEDKLRQMLTRNVSRASFAQRLKEIIDRYNAGGSLTDDYFNDLVSFVEQLRDEEERHIREGLTEPELEIFDLLKKDTLTKEETQKVKLAAQRLLIRLRNEKPTVLVNDWYKDTVTKLNVKSTIQEILNNLLPESYDRDIYSEKCDRVFDHFYSQAVGADKSAA